MKKLLLIAFCYCIFSNAANSQHDYALAQHLATYFLGAQRCGNTQSWCHGACHLQDGKTVGHDLSGGWHDCGDYIKFLHTGPYAAAVCLTGYEYYPEAYADDYSQAFSAPPSNGIPDILDEVKIETDYLIKSVTKDTVFWQIGDSTDHDGFDEPVYQSANGPDGDPRVVYSTTHGYSNVCGDAAAALSLMSIVYRKFDSNYADSCIAAAEEYYAIGSINPATSNADPSSFYSFTDYEDEMGYGAIMLYRVTNKSNYLTDAQNYAGVMDVSDPLYYGNVSYLAFLELYKVTGDTTYLEKVGTEVNSEISQVLPCGVYWYDNSGSLEYAAESALLACIYHSITADTSVYTYAKTAVNYILGSHAAETKNAPANFSFMIGYDQLGGGYPQYPQHAAAFGKTGLNDSAWTYYDEEQKTPGSVPYKYLLKGAMVGGPSKKCANYIDNISNSTTNEPCIYYNSGLIGALAYVNKIENNITTGLNKPVANADVNIYPNPVTETLRISCPVNTNFQLYDILGKMVLSFNINQSGSIDVGGLKPGLYILKNADQTIYKKIIKE